MSIELPQYNPKPDPQPQPAFTDPYSNNPYPTNYPTAETPTADKQSTTTTTLSPCVYYIIAWVLFILAIGINLSMWAIDRYAANSTQASNYYSASYPVSTYMNGNSYTDSTMIYGSTPNDVRAIALSLLYSWVLWKIALIIFTYNLAQHEESTMKKIVLVCIQLLIMLAIDILGSIFLLSIYNDYIFFAIYTGLAVVIAIITGKKNEKGQVVLSAIIPLFLIAFYYACYSIFLPTLYYQYSSLQYGASFLIIYLYPFFDLLLYGMLLAGGTFVEDNCRNFHGTIHFLLLGYGVGMIMLVGYTEVEFYYLLGYFMFRNVFVNWIMRKWERVVCNPPVLPGWIIVYYLSYLLNFLPVIGVGKLVVSAGFSSQIFSSAQPQLYSSPNPLYPSSTWSLTSINTSFSGNVFWLCGAIIWVGVTFTQQYPRRKPLWYDLGYYLLGIHFFYVGIVCALAIPSMTSQGAHL